ncbi:MAG: hypothetical protein CL917_18565 [Deltaproteobacteria bacterium]|nr:hypothetical protein [Deltaproteobacteria bacterium]
MAQVVIANRLRDGIVVFLGTNHTWVEQLQDCTPSESKEDGQRLMDISQEAADQQEIVDPNLIEVEKRGQTWHAIKMREEMRAKGPTVREDLGKQAGN